MKTIKMKKTESAGKKIYEYGKTYVVADIHASQWCNAGICERVKRTKKPVKEVKEVKETK